MNHLSRCRKLRTELQQHLSELNILCTTIKEEEDVNQTIYQFQIMMEKLMPIKQQADAVTAYLDHA